MRKLNKDSSVLENTVEAYLEVCISACQCECGSCPGSPGEQIKYGTQGYKSSLSN